MWVEIERHVGRHNEKLVRNIHLFQFGIETAPIVRVVFSSP